MTVGGRDSAPLSRLRRQLGRNYRRATARSLSARLPARLRLQTVHWTVCLTASPWTDATLWRIGFADQPRAIKELRKAKHNLLAR